MSEGMFNSDQMAWMDYLATIPPEQRCWCGWELLGHDCKPGVTLADRKKNQCQSCGADLPGHRVHCKVAALYKEEKP